MGDLGVPDSYEVWVVSSAGAGGARQTLVAQLPFNQLAWQRIANDVSAASVSVVGSKFVPKPWAQALRIYRNGYPVWSGPIVSYGRDPNGTLRIGARDGAVDMQKQFIAVSRNYVKQTVTGVVKQIFADCGLGTVGHSPYLFDIGTFYPLGFYPRSGVLAAPAGNVGDAPITRELSVERLERVYDVIADFTGQGKFFYTYAPDRLYVNEVGIRQQLCVGDSGWPVLHDRNVADIPSVNSDALDVATSIYEPAPDPANPVPTTLTVHPITGGFDFVDGVFQGATPGGRGETWPSTLPRDYLGSLTLGASMPKHRDEGSYAEFDAHAAVADHAVPKVSVEQVTLLPSFSHPSLADDLSNLLPGCRFKVGFDDKSMFEVPFAEKKVSIAATKPDTLTYATSAPYHFTSDPQLFDAFYWFDWRPLSLWRQRIDHLRLIQMDVTVSASNGAFSEQVALSLVPTAEYVLAGYATATTVNASAFDGTPVVGTIPARPRFVG